MSDAEQEADPVKAFVDENREWLRQEAGEDHRASWVAERLLAAYPEVDAE